MEPSKKRKDVDQDKESSRLERDDDDEQEIDQGRHSESSPSKIKKCSPKKSSLSTSVADHSSAPSSQQPPGGNHGAQERGQRHSDQSVQPPVMEASRYYTRSSAARKLTPPPPIQLRAGKILIQNVDRGTRHVQVYKNTLMRETATSRVKRLVPDAQPNVSRIVPLGPPPPHDDPNWFNPRMITKFSKSSGTGAESSQNSQAAEVAGRFDHIPPPSLPYGDALEMLVAFNERVKNLKDGSDKREQFLALQKDLGFPESAGLFGLYQISGSVLTNYLMDYFKWWESRKANVPESSQTEGQVSPEKDSREQKKTSEK